MIRVAVVEDLSLTRDALRVLLGATDGFSCAGLFGSVEQALGVSGAEPDVILLDIGLPGMSGADGVRLLQEKWPAAAIVMHTVFAEDDKVFRALCNGAVGYVLKRTPPAQLLEAIRDAHAGGAPMSPEIARKVITLFRRVAPRPNAPDELAPQETRLLQLLAEGYGYADAAHKLDISLNTVRTYVRRIYAKLHVHSRAAAVSKALRAGLI